MKQESSEVARQAAALRKKLDAQPIPTEGRMIWLEGADRPIMAKQPNVQVIIDNKPDAHRLRIKIGKRFFVQTTEKDSDEPVTFDDEKTIKTAAKAVNKALQEPDIDEAIPWTHQEGVKIGTPAKS